MLRQTRESKRLCRIFSRCLPLFVILYGLAGGVEGCSPGIFNGIGNFVRERVSANDAPAASSSTGFQTVPNVTPIAPPLSSAIPALREPAKTVEIDLGTPGDSEDVIPELMVAAEAPNQEVLSLPQDSVVAEEIVVHPSGQLEVLQPGQLEGLNGRESAPQAPTAAEDGLNLGRVRADTGYALGREEAGGEAGLMLGERNVEELQQFARWSEQQLEPFLPAVVGQALGLSLSSAARAADAISGGRLGAAGRAAEGWVEDARGWVESQPEVLMWRLQPGDHLRVRGVAGLVALTHHAIYLGDGRIMHFTGGVQDKSNATCKVDSLRALYNFGRGTEMRVEVMEHPADALPRHVIVQRALTRVGETGYNLFSNNCEHLVNWCVSGRSSCQQVERFLADPVGLGREILQKQAEVGQPLGLQQIAHTLLPPSLLRPVEMLQRQREALLRRFAPPPPQPEPSPLDRVTLWLRERLPLPFQPASPAPAMA